MPEVCMACLGEAPESEGYHSRCLRELFGTDDVPEVDVEMAKLHELGLAMVGKTSLSGVQRKISVGLSSDRMTLRLEVERNRFILKPQAQTFPALPENEHATMQTAALCGLEVPPNALVRLKDGSLAYLVARFDRTPEGIKRRQEDFCQLDERWPKQKYDGSAELCVRLVRRYASEPGIALLRLFQHLVFAWWAGNGDAHLKNFSLLEDAAGRHALSPTYDQVCTRLVIPRDGLALTVGGRRDRLNRRTWEELAGYGGIPPRAAARVLDRQAQALESALDLVSRSFLPGEMKEGYADLLRERTDRLAG